MLSKRCFKCNRTLPTDSFYAHPRMGDGHLNKCKECTKADTAANRLAKIEYYREYDRNRGRLPSRIGKQSARTAEWRKAYPDRWQAQIALNNAVGDGVVKPHPCWVCRKKAQAHHPDYSRPLDVVWLCPQHHKAAHRVAA